MEMHRGWYWQIYGRWFIHKVHLRALDHIKNQSEQKSRAAGQQVSDVKAVGLLLISTDHPKLRRRPIDNGKDWRYYHMLLEVYDARFLGFISIIRVG